VKQLIKRHWMTIGLSERAFEYQRLVVIENGVAVLLNARQGTLTYIKVG
jgi:hypothetical protein